MHLNCLNCPLTSCRVLSLPPDFAFCLRVRRRGDVKLERNATNTLMSNAAIVDFSATMFDTSVSDISSDNNFFNVSEWPVVCVRHRRGLSCRRRLHGGRYAACGADGRFSEGDAMR